MRWVLAGGGVAALCGVPAVVAGPGWEARVARALEASTEPAAVGAVVVALLALDTVLPVPSSIVATAAGQRLGFVGGALVVAVGLCTGNAIGYAIGRTAAVRPLGVVVGRAALARARRAFVARPGMAALALTRPVPLLSEATVVLAGAARAPLAATAAACGLANAGLAAAYAAMGSAAHGDAAIPLGMAGSVGVPAFAVAAAAAAGRHRPGTRRAGAGARERGR